MALRERRLSAGSARSAGAAGAMSGVWKAPPTLRGIARRKPELLGPGDEPPRARASVAADDDLAGSVEVREVAARRSPRRRPRPPRGSPPRSATSPPGASLGSVAHRRSPRRDQSGAVAARHDPGRHEGRVLAEAVAEHQHRLPARARWRRGRRATGRTWRSGRSPSPRARRHRRSSRASQRRHHVASATGLHRGERLRALPTGRRRRGRGSPAQGTRAPTTVRSPLAVWHERPRRQPTRVSTRRATASIHLPAEVTMPWFEARQRGGDVGAERGPRSTARRWHRVTLLATPLGGAGRFDAHPRGVRSPQSKERP